jgi:hypothetical protein
VKVKVKVKVKGKVKVEAEGPEPVEGLKVKMGWGGAVEGRKEKS